ncbi:hypothetical protein CHEID_02185 [Corynebacterium heidelbergense]|nr:hypothetical protein CHEID_02185 [Corynebacterium heidelbergense]
MSPKLLNRCRICRGCGDCVGGAGTTAGLSFLGLVVLGTGCGGGSARLAGCGCAWCGCSVGGLWVCGTKGARGVHCLSPAQGRCRTMVAAGSREVSLVDRWDKRLAVVDASLCGARSAGPTEVALRNMHPVGPTAVALYVVPRAGWLAKVAPHGRRPAGLGRLRCATCTPRVWVQRLPRPVAQCGAGDLPVCRGGSSRSPAIPACCWSCRCGCGVGELRLSGVEGRFPGRLVGVVLGFCSGGGCEVSGVLPLGGARWGWRPKGKRAVTTTPPALDLSP